MCFWLFGAAESNTDFPPSLSVRELTEISDILDDGRFLGAIALSGDPCWFCGFVPNRVKQALHEYKEQTHPEPERLTNAFHLVKMALASNDFGALVSEMRDIENHEGAQNGKLQRVLSQVSGMTRPGAYATPVLYEKLAEALTELRNQIL